jgi:uridine kinase
LRSALLDPLGPGGNRQYRVAVFDHQNDLPVVERARYATEDAILLVDGVFLLRPELIRYWDFSIFVHSEFDVTLRRAVNRDARRFGGAVETLRRYRERYISGQQIYLREVQPQVLASVIVDNNDVTRPVLRAETGRAG